MAKIDHIVFWKPAKWLARKYRCSFKSLMVKRIRRPSASQAKTWIVYGKSNKGSIYVALSMTCITVSFHASLFRLMSNHKMRFMWRQPENNPHLRLEERNTVTSLRYKGVVMVVSH